MSQRQWHRGDGAEQTDSSADAAQERLARDFELVEDPDDVDVGGNQLAADDWFDSAYLSWRLCNGTALDGDYRRWRQETGQPFSQAFLEWARGRDG